MGPGRLPVPALLLAACLALAACGEQQQAAPPPPAPLSRDAVGHYDQMTVLDHQGPKAQILVAGRDRPYWFSSVRDAVAFTLLPEEPKDIAAIYVSDMARAAGWDDPGEVWVEARTAHFVIGSDRMGGMGQPEPVPFSDPGRAEAFAREHGGQVVAFDAIPRDYVLGPGAPAMAEGGAPAAAPHPGH